MVRIGDGLKTALGIKGRGARREGDGCRVRVGWGCCIWGVNRRNGGV